MMRRYATALICLVAGACAGDATPQGDARGRTDQASTFPEAGPGADGALPAADGGPRADGALPAADGPAPTADGPVATDGPPGGLAACEALTPQASAAANRQAIRDCLQQYGIARLQAGVFPVSDGIPLPAGAKLLGATGAWPTLRLAAGSTTNYLVATGDGSRVGLLKLDAAGQLKGRPHASIVSVGGSNASVDNNHIFNAQQAAPGDHAAAVYVIGDKVSGNMINNNQLYNAFYGVIFRGGLTQAGNNTIKGCTIRDIKCDSVSLAGYGAVLDNTITHNGWDCENGPIPGGGIYGLNQAEGALIEGNTIHDNCGHGIDLDGVASFVVRNNTIYDPGYQWNGARGYCSGASGIAVIDIRESTFEGNDVRNQRVTNRIGLSGDPNSVFSRFADKSYSDLPHQGQQVIAFWLARRRNTATPTMHNTIRGNTFIASCGAGASCVGLGYFASRNTGLDAGGGWSAATTNYYTKNNPFGSQVGSKRCGSNWYAANDTCGDPATGDCNVDDYQHNPPAGDWARNDDCKAY